MNPTETPGRPKDPAAASPCRPDWHRELWAALPVGLLIADLDGIVLAANQELGRLLGQAAGRLEGRGLEAVLDLDDLTRHETALRAVAAGQRDRLSASIRLRRADGSPADCEIVVGRLAGTADRGPAMVIVVSAAEGGGRVERRSPQEAGRDEPTGLLDWHTFLAEAAGAIKRAAAQARRLLLIYADVDGLGSVNEQCGRAEGDQVLAQVARSLQATFHGGDLIARFGGDEFVALLEVGDEADEGLIASRLQHELRRQEEASQRVVGASLSIGCACVEPAEPCALDDLIERAERAMRAPQRG